MTAFKQHKVVAAAMAECPYCAGAMTILLDVSSHETHGLVFSDARVVLDAHLVLNPDCPLSSFYPETTKEA